MARKISLTEGMCIKQSIAVRFEYETQSNLMVVFSVCILATLGMLLRARSDKWNVFDFYIMLLIIVYKKT